MATNPSTTNAIKTKFATIADLQAYVDALTAAASAPKTKTPPAKTPTADEQKQAQFLEEAKQELTKRVQKKKDFVKSAPLFKKPAFYLDQLSPILNVDLVVLFQNRKTLNDLPQERRFRIFNDTNNHLVTFKYNVGGTADSGSSGIVELVFIDPKQEITEYLSMQLASLNTVLNGAGSENNPSWVRLEIEFGWSHNPDNVPNGLKDWDKIAFTNKVIAVVQTMKTTFNNLGLPETTITCNAENASSIVFRGASPFEIFGPFPATTLCFEELNRLFRLVFDKLRKNDTKDTATKAIQQLGFFLYNRGLMDVKLTADIIEVAAKYYGSIFDAFVYQKNMNKDRINYVINHKMHFYNPKFVDIYDLMEEVVNPPDVGIEALADNAISKKTVSLYHTEYRSKIDGELTLSAEQRLFTNYFTKTGTAIHNCFKIHPYYLYVYVSNYIYTQLNKTNPEDQQNMYIELWDYNADLQNALMPQEYFKAARDKKPYVFRKAQGGKPEDEAFFINAIDVSLTLSTKWEVFLNMIFAKMFVKYTPIDKKNPSRGLQFEIDDAEKKTIATQGFIPLPLQCNVMYLDGKMARKNIDIWIQALELRQKYLEQTVKKTETPISDRDRLSSSIKSDSKDVIIKTKTKATTITPTDSLLTSTQQLIENAKAQRNLITTDKYYLINMLTIKITSAQVFGADIGSQMIAQVFSYRIGGEYEGMFNPGEPTCWEINFPDVISFAVERDSFQAAISVASSARVAGTTDRGQYFISSQAQTKKTKLLQEATDLAKDKSKSKDLNAPLRNSLSANELSQLKDKLNELLALDPAAKLASTSPARTAAYPINVTIQDYQHSRVYSGDYYNMLERKREVQNIRAAMMTSGVEAKGDIEFLGDPTFAFMHTLSYWTFIKVINIDGTLSILTGLYKIEGITHEISAGKFTTKFQIRSDGVGDGTVSPEYTNQMKTIIYGSDKQKAYMGE